MNELKKRNHYVPRMYLKQWSDDGNRVHMYRLLVSSEKVPLWKQASIKGIAFHEHLYTRIAGGDQSDEFERWIEAEFETPAEKSFQSAIEGKKLSKEEWWCLVNFLAAQDVRTPARLMESMNRWKEKIPIMIQEVTETAAKMLEEGKLPRKNPRPTLAHSKLLPIRVSTYPSDQGEGENLLVETDIGRGYWLFQIKHLLSTTVQILHSHKSSLMVPPNEIEWLTSDDPVIKLNFQSETQFDFGGDWNSPGTEIMMPLGPKKLMYTKIGSKKLPREIFLDASTARLINRLIARHAHRAIFSTRENEEVCIFRPRRVDASIDSYEKKQWSEWAEEVSGLFTQ